MTHKPEGLAEVKGKQTRPVDGGLTHQRQTLVKPQQHKWQDGSMSDIGFDGFDGFDGFSLEGYVRAREAISDILCLPLERTRQIRQTAIRRRAVWWFAFDVAPSNGRQPGVKGVA